MAELYIGLMSGTSLDAIDTTLVDFSTDKPRLLAAHNVPLPADLRKTLLALNRPAAGEIARMAQADVELGKHLAQAVTKLLALHNIDKSEIRAIGSHGQTLRHNPDANLPYTLQIGDPNTIAELTGITTIADFRRRDLAASGQGAPLMPAFHAAYLRVNDASRVIVNIGGMANITLLPANPNKTVTGFDTGPGNVLMDGWYQRHQKGSYDKGGQWAASGKIEQAFLQRMQRDKFFKLAPPKSTGRDHFDMRWLDRLIKRHGKRMQRKHVQASLCELTAWSIATAINEHAADAHDVIVCGGGVHNTALMFRLQALLDGRQVLSSEDFDIDPDYMEAMGFAWLAMQTLGGKPGNLPSVTGATHPVVLGGIYPA
jgi:anhydro-N-acetylmuramic acid kinase